MANLREYISHYCELSSNELDAIVNLFTARTIKKKRHILKPGQIASEFIYTVEGCFRQYYRDNKGREITTWIVFDDMLATELSSFFTGQPTRFYIEAITDCKIQYISSKDLNKLYKQLPHFQEFGRKIAEEVVVGAINRVVSHLHEPAFERYEKLMHRSEYIQKIPLKHLASFLGVTDTSLSRLRKQKGKS